MLAARELFDRRRPQEHLAAVLGRRRRLELCPGDRRQQRQQHAVEPLRRRGRRQLAQPRAIRRHRYIPERHLRSGHAGRPRHAVAARRKRAHRPAGRQQRRLVRRGGMEPLRRRQPADAQCQRDLHARQVRQQLRRLRRRQWRRRLHAPDAMVPGRFAAPDAARNHGRHSRARPRCARRRGPRRRQPLLYGAEPGLRRHPARRRHQRGHAVLGVTDRPDRRHLRRPGPAQAGLHDRPSLCRGGDRAGLVQRRDRGQQCLVLPDRQRRRRLQLGQRAAHADRLWATMPVRATT